jgi:manganese/zinc/iron transport system substrate-binding protein
LKEPESFLFVDGQVDPHVWMDVSLWAKMVELIRDELILLEPKEESFFRERSNALKGDMEMLHENIYALLQKIPAEKRYLVTSHDAFNYFAKRYLREEGEEDAKKRFIAPEGLAPDGQLRTADIQRTIDHLSLYQIGVVFPESNVSRDSLKKIVSVCAQKGLDVRIAPDELYADAMGAEGSSADNYFKMMEHNAAVIAQSLQAKK